jgi:hypothetical protein
MRLDDQQIIRPFQPFFRTKRMKKFVDYFGVTDDTSILDSGAGCPAVC